MEKAFELFDAYNQQDPRMVSWEGKEYPYEYFYALQLYHWVKKLEPNASESLLLASRSQHIGRWQIPREQYPEGKAGYIKWRTDLAKIHAEKAGELMAQAGYKEEEIQQVQHIILKQQLKKDPEVQVMENALCLVFLQFQYDEFLTKHDDDMMVRILQRTWKKMSEPGREAAMGLSFSERGKLLIQQALA